MRFIKQQNWKKIGKQYDDSTPSNGLALATLEYYHDYGLWAAVEQPDGLYLVTQKKLTDEEYETAYNRIITLDEYGYGPDDKKPKRR